MSHFMLCVLVPKDCPNPEAYIGRQMEPFNENIEVPEYGKACYCIGSQAREDSHEAGLMAVDAKKFDDIRDRFHSLGNIKKLHVKIHDARQKGDYETVDYLDGEVNRAWKEYLKPFNAVEADALAHHKNKNDPDPKCEECEGTGTHKSTYNPNSKWDWYVIGGRWDGEIQNSPHRSDNGFNFGEEHHKLVNNSRSVHDILADEKLVIPFAFLVGGSTLLTDGEWIERGGMGWWGMVSDETEKEDWTVIVRKIYEKCSDRIAVGVDCHI